MEFLYISFPPPCPLEHRFWAPSVPDIVRHQFSLHISSTRNLLPHILPPHCFQVFSGSSVRAYISTHWNNIPLRKLSFDCHILGCHTIPHIFTGERIYIYFFCFWRIYLLQQLLASDRNWLQSFARNFRLYTRFRPFASDCVLGSVLLLKIYLVDRS